MPITLACPHCHRPLTAPDTAAGRVVKCTNCKKALSIPHAALPAPEPEPIIQHAEPDSPRPRYLRREPMTMQSKFFILVGLMVAVVMGLVIYDRAEAFYIKKRFQSLQREERDLLYRLDVRAAEIRVGDPKKAGSLPPPTFEETQSSFFQNDPEWIRLNKRLGEVVNELIQMMHDHPELKALAPRA